MAIFKFQTMIANLTDMETAKDSIYSCATSCAEAVLMAKRITKRPNVHIHGELHPQYRELIDTYTSTYADVEVKTSAPDANAACVIVQTPDFFGRPQALADIRKQ